MSVAESFRELMQRVRQGDARAAAELVHQYEPEIRRAIRLRLSSSHLRRVLDSMDICQSVLGNFFVRACAGQFDLEEPGQLVRLLTVMARNKLRNHATFQQAARRDQRRLHPDGPAALEGIAGLVPTPSQIVARQELLRVLRLQMTADEQYLAEQRAAGRGWAEIAAELGVTPEGLRKRYTRTVDRVVQHLRRNEVDHA